MTKTIKIVTYNIWHGTYLDKVIEFLRAEKPDVACLQEVSTKGKGLMASDDNILSDLQEALDMNAVYTPIFGRKQAGGMYEIGDAILSPHGLYASAVTPYAGEYKIFEEEDDFRYVWPSAVLKASVESLDLTIATTHLPVTPKATVTKRQLTAAKEVKEIVENYEEMILCGDMNTPYQSETYQVLSEGLTDVSNSTEPTLHPTIHPVGYMGYHVDYIFYQNPRLTHLSTRVPIVDGSDHLPVVAEFQISST
jgi:endonuclease/exonuclease/phosphatase family metal-dependent hydrolase